MAQYRRKATGEIVEITLWDGTDSHPRVFRSEEYGTYHLIDENVIARDLSSGYDLIVEQPDKPYYGVIGSFTLNENYEAVNL